MSIGKLQKRNISTTFPGTASKTIHAFFKNKHGVRILSATMDNLLYNMDMVRRPHPVGHKAYPAETLAMLHQRLGHIPFRKIRGMSSFLKTQNIHICKSKSNAPCMACAMGKLQRNPAKKSRTHPAKEALEVIHTDISGPYAKSRDGNRWLLLFVDEYTRLVTTYAMKTKGAALEHFKKYKLYIENDRKATIQRLAMSDTTRDQILRLQSDGGGEYTSTAFDKFLASTGIQHYTSNADNPSQNGMAERYIRTVTESALSMLKHANLADAYWPYATRTASYLLNRIPKKILKDISPYEKWTGTAPDLRSLRTFGVDAHVRVVTQNKRKGGDKSHPCTFLGYREGLKGYVFENKKTKRILKNGDAIFYEGDWLLNGVKRFDFLEDRTPSTSTAYGLPPSSPSSDSEGDSDCDSDSDHNMTDGSDSDDDDDVTPPTAMPGANIDAPSVSPPMPQPVLLGEHEQKSPGERELNIRVTKEGRAKSPERELNIRVTKEGRAKSPTAPKSSLKPTTPLASEVNRKLTFSDQVMPLSDSTQNVAPLQRALMNPNLSQRPRRDLAIYNKRYNVKQKRRRSPTPPPHVPEKRKKKSSRKRIRKGTPGKLKKKKRSRDS